MPQWVDVGRYVSRFVATFRLRWLLELYEPIQPLGVRPRVIKAHLVDEWTINANAMKRYRQCVVPVGAIDLFRYR